MVRALPKCLSLEPDPASPLAILAETRPGVLPPMESTLVGLVCANRASRGGLRSRRALVSRRL